MRIDLRLEVVSKSSKTVQLILLLNGSVLTSVGLGCLLLCKFIFLCFLLLSLYSLVSSVLILQHAPSAKASGSTIIQADFGDHVEQW